MSWRIIRTDPVDLAGKTGDFAAAAIVTSARSLPQSGASHETCAGVGGFTFLR